MPEGQVEGKTRLDLLIWKSIPLRRPGLYKRNRFKFVKAQIPFFILLYLIRFHLTNVALRDGNSVIKALTLF